MFAVDPSPISNIECRRCRVPPKSPCSFSRANEWGGAHEDDTHFVREYIFSAREPVRRALRQWRRLNALKQQTFFPFVAWHPAEQRGLDFRSAGRFLHWWRIGQAEARRQHQRTGRQAGDG